MAKDMTKELLDVIKAQLPETQVGLIKEALNERDVLRESVIAYEKKLEEQSKKTSDLFTEFSDLDAKYVSLNLKYDDIKIENERLVLANKGYEQKDIERRAELAEGKLSIIQQTQELFLKNTIVREKVQHQVVDEFPNMVSQYTPTGTVMSQQGVNKTHRGVTDIKETSTEKPTE